MNPRRLLTNVLLWPIRCALSVLFRLPNLRGFNVVYSKSGYTPDTKPAIIDEARLFCSACGRWFRVPHGRFVGRTWENRWRCWRCIGESSNLDKWV